MNDILEEILTYKREEVEQWKQYIHLKQLYGMMEYGKLDKIEQPSLQLALEKSNTGVIAEFKRKTPLHQWINQGAKASKIPYEFQRGGAVAISIPTDKPCFGGYDEYVQEAKATGVTIPIVYNNFIIDEYQLFQARRVGASAVVLNSLLLSIEQCHSLQSLAHQLGLEVVLEIHSVDKLDYLDLQPDVCAVNNRDLRTFEVDINVSLELARHLPDNILKISEGGINSLSKINLLKEEGYQGFVIGEYLMRQENPGVFLRNLISELEK